jgi:probable F420-dependent oxidoreductase
MTSQAKLPLKPFRFGIQVSTQPDRASWVNLAKRTEASGFDVLTMPDHFTDQLAPIPALMTVADNTATLRVGALVWDNDYKHPVVLAKELATIDVLSGGRLEIGLGAGWMISDYEQSGLIYDRPGVRIDRFIEGLDVIRGCMAAESFSYAGTHYTITNYNGLPKPIQAPCPPILVGGGGKRVLTYAAQHANIIGINATLTAGAVGPEVIATMSAAAVDDKVAIVRNAVGGRINDIEMNIRAFMVNVTDDAQGAINRLAKAMHVEDSMIAESPFALIGPPSKLIEDLLARRERWGFSYVIVGGDDIDSFAPVVAALRGT